MEKSIILKKQWYVLTKKAKALRLARYTNNQSHYGGYIRPLEKRNMKKKYFVTVTTQYDGYEWVQKDILEGKNEKAVIKIINQPGYFTHDNGCEEVKNYSIEELTQRQYIALCKFV